MSVNIEIKAVSEDYIPVKAHYNDAAYDVRACIETEFILEPGTRMMIPVGFHLGLPNGYEALITPRSGLAVKRGLTVLNSPGTIDAGFRGEVQVILLNTGEEAYHVQPGERIAQMKIQKVLPTTLIPVSELNETERGTTGFGDSGTDALQKKNNNNEQLSTGIARYISEVPVMDPDSKSTVSVTMFKDENSGSIFGVDTSFIEEMDEPIIREPFNQTLVRLMGV